MRGTFAAGRLQLRFGGIGAPAPQDSDPGLERNGEDSAAASLREGLEDMLTVLTFDPRASLRGFLLTTNAVENLVGSVRPITRNVTRWRSGDMIARWSGVGLSNAERKEATLAIVI